MYVVYKKEYCWMSYFDVKKCVFLDTFLFIRHVARYHCTN